MKVTAARVLPIQPALTIELDSNEAALFRKFIGAQDTLSVRETVGDWDFSETFTLLMNLVGATKKASE